MIEELLKPNTEIDPLDYNEPLLEYAIKVANQFWQVYDPTIYILDDGTKVEGQFLPSTIPYDFACRYSNKEIDDSKKQKYVESEEVQDTLRAFGLDSSKFWYLSLMIKDYVESRTKNALKLNPTHRERLLNIVKQIDKLDYNDKKTFEYEGTGELSIKIGKEKPYKITDSTTLGIIRFAIAKLLQEAPISHRILDTIKVDKKDTVNLPLVYHIYMFNHYLSWFLKDVVAIKGIYASKDKSLLTSRMIYILGISDDIRYYQDYSGSGDKLNFLKQNLSKYKNIDIRTISNTYFL